jgi:hypothetical protein
MDIGDEQLRDDGAKTARKPYRKPGVQVYGTLAQMTGSTAAQPSAHPADPAAPPSSGRRT